MSDNTVPLPTNAPKPESPEEKTKRIVADVSSKYPLRGLVRNETTLTPVWEPVQRGVAKDCCFPVVLPTEANFQDWLKYKGLKNVIEQLQATERQNAQATIDYVIKQNNLWIDVQKTDIDSKPVFEDGVEEVEVEEVNDKGEKVKKTVKKQVKIPVVARSYYDYDKIPLEELLNLLERGSIRSGITIAKLEAENEELNTKMREMVAAMMKNPGDAGLLAEAFSLTQKVQENEEAAQRIRDSRGKGKISSAAD